MTDKPLPGPQSAPPLRIRLATEADIPRLVPMINAAFTVETFLEGTRTDIDRLSAYFRKGEFLLAEDASGQLIGSIYTELRPPRGYLGMLAVDPAHQRAGHGRTLMAAGEDHLRGKGCVAVDICVIAWRTELPPSTANSATSRPPSRTSNPPSASSPASRPANPSSCPSPSKESLHKFAF